MFYGLLGTLFCAFVTIMLFINFAPLALTLLFAFMAVIAGCGTYEEYVKWQENKRK